MKKIFPIVILISILVLPAIALAAPTEAPTEIIPIGPTSGDDIILIIENVANWMFAILLAVALVFVLLAAYQFLTSGGDPTRVTSARQSLMFALVGVGIALLARSLIYAVRIVLGI